ncbi:hypothetical protein [Nocardia sp. NPDC059239]|uniref:hypothetical protein n=1 Tax=unclassified Nocardia TaxID=2637762 RepID=UPI0036ABF056
MPELVSHHRPRARKAHQCMMCARRIDPGEVYHRQFGRDGGDVWTWKECQHCTAATKILGLWQLHSYEEGIGPIDFEEYEPGTAEQVRLIAGWRAQWRHEDGSLWEVPEGVE